MFYAQVDSRWKNTRLGGCSDTIGQSGCFVTSLANLAWKNPLEVNTLLRDKGGFVSGCLISPEKTASLLGLEYHGKTTTKPNYVCIAETHYYAPKVPQHFFLWNPDGRIADPLNMSPDWQVNSKPYPIVSYRLFRFNKPADPVVPTPPAPTPVTSTPAPTPTPVPSTPTPPPVTSPLPTPPKNNSSGFFSNLFSGFFGLFRK